MASRPRWRTAFGVGGLVIGAGCLAASVPAWLARDAYANAPDCDGDRARDCVATLPATVLGTSRTANKGPDTYYVTLRIQGDPTTDEVELPGREPFYEALAEGDTVRVRVWRDRVTRLGATGLGETKTGEDPGVESLELTLYGLFGLTLGGLGVWSGLAELVGRGEEDRGPFFRLGIALAVASGVEMFVVTGFDIYGLLPVTLSGAVIAAVAYVVAMRNHAAA